MPIYYTPITQLNLHGHIAKKFFNKFGWVLMWFLSQNLKI
ncbi:hypothetical protein VAE130_550578 [Vibrio aestuarianus]|uniref:Uncharacterized protein n=1 Tax=Vibrio aestuarianus TaxID=28171 RepID=A0ABN8TTC1_9VIBR|nr:hypothetical protein VAE308_1030004 [Vibrio aestuarianus]CAH8189989.1 hypothetical protein VAE032_250100 [Vibrio aestuarianus]CAH8190241.1 hypothetical protein VAE128_440572 [Vibrio aestuarianus]CAH8190440.1 hypothetical protein VAE130_550578 [Vibrio aestuarianus]CAH8190632.1 hypothetical protein VAE115_300099 [Vibrio aestuarianus]